ncbi:MAG: SpoIIE family protein phosphatase [Planctomycetota bacterium]
MDSTSWDIQFRLLDNHGQVVGLQPGQSYLFGRSMQAAFCLADTLASREHCEIYWNDRGMPVLRDLESRNGTYINGERMRGFQELHDHDQIQIGGLQFTLRLLPAGSDPESVISEGQDHELNKLETFQLSSQHLGAGQGASFSGTTRDGKLDSMLRFFCLTDKTGVLILNDDLRRRIWFVDGVPRDAICDDQEGLDALIQLCRQPGELFAFLEGERGHRADTIVGSEADVLGTVLPPTELAQLGIDASDLARAEDLQKHLLGAVPELPGYEIGLYYRGRSGVSGDLYDFGRLADGRFFLFLADVSGHGIQAALVVTNTLKTLRFLRAQHHELLPLLCALNDEIRGDLLAGQFLTCFAALLDPSKGLLEVVLAGHHPALLFDMDSPEFCENVGRQGVGLGLMEAGQFRDHIQVQTIGLEPGDSVLQFTDGLSEASNKAHEEYGLERIVDSIKRHGGASAQAMADGLAADAETFADQLADDCTVLVLHRRITSDTEVVQVHVGMQDEDDSHTQPDAPRRSSTANDTALETASLNWVFGDSIPAFEAQSLLGRLLGNVEIIAHIGTSQVAHVYRGRHTTMGTDVALKVLRLPGDEQQRHLRHAFLQRAAAAGRVSHAHVVQVLDAGTTSDGFTWLAMQLADQDTLADRIGQTGPARLGGFLSLAEPLAGGLHAIHIQSVVHGDLRPENILFDQNEVAKIADFVVPTGTDEHLPYCAPERRGKPICSSASDIYALGGIYVFMLTGQAPPVEAPRDTVASILRAAVPAIEAPLLALLTSCFDPKPESRPTAIELSRRLRHAQTLYSARQVAINPTPIVGNRATPLLLILVIILTVLCAVLLVLLLMR